MTAKRKDDIRKTNFLLSEVVRKSEKTTEGLILISSHFGGHSLTAPACFTRERGQK